MVNEYTEEEARFRESYLGICNRMRELRTIHHSLREYHVNECLVELWGARKRLNAWDRYTDIQDDYYVITGYHEELNLMEKRLKGWRDELITPAVRSKSTPSHPPNQTKFSQE